MAPLSQQTVIALNALLEDERASVQSEVALASGSTEYAERQALALMGREDVEICAALHERLAQAQAAPSRTVSDAAEAILAAERYDERLRAFAEHQRVVSRRASELALEVTDAEAQQILRRLAELHAWHVRWAERRADDFAATRLWENGRKPREGRSAEQGAGLEAEAGADLGSGREAPSAPPGDQASGMDGLGSGRSGAASEADKLRDNWGERPT
jgi:hypothetical protein